MPAQGRDGSSASVPLPPTPPSLPLPSALSPLAAGAVVWPFSYIAIPRPHAPTLTAHTSRALASAPSRDRPPDIDVPAGRGRYHRGQPDAAAADGRIVLRTHLACVSAWRAAAALALVWSSVLSSLACHVYTYTPCVCNDSSVSRSLLWCALDDRTEGFCSLQQVAHSPGFKIFCFHELGYSPVESPKHRLN